MTRMARIKPASLNLGDTVAVVAPASGVVNPTAIYFGQQLLENMGYRVKLGEAVFRRHGYLAGTDAERLQDLETMFADPEVKAIICLRGGYGAMRLLDKLNLQLIKENPKILLGFSDITALHIAITQMTGLVTFHGPVLNSMASWLGDYTRENLIKVIANPAPAGVLTNPEAGPHLFAICGGKGSGELIGGNLSLVCATLGTPFEIETKGKILFLEEVGEEPYRIDRMLVQLALAGKFNDVKGIIFGESLECTPKKFKPSFSCTFSLEEVIIERFKGMKVPVLYNLACGHGREKLTLPLGVAATLDADAGMLYLRESAVKRQ